MWLALSLGCYINEYNLLIYVAILFILKESASHIRAYTPKGLVKLQLGLLTIVYKAQFDPIIARYGTQQTH